MTDQMTDIDAVSYCNWDPVDISYESILVMYLLTFYPICPSLGDIGVNNKSTSHSHWYNKFFEW